MESKVIEKKPKKYTRPSKDDYYLNIAKAVSERSTCYHWKCGAIIVRNNGDIVSTGYNGSAKDQSNCIDCGECPYEKAHGIKPDGSQSQCFGVHAEMNAMLRAGHSDMEGSTLYIYCKDRDSDSVINVDPGDVDARMIRNSGISRIVTGSGNVGT